MSRPRFEIPTRLVVLLLVIAAYAPATARAGEHEPHLWCGPSECLGFPTAWLTTAGVYPPGNPWCYQIPIQAVYQFPAKLANQPGAEVGWLEVHPTPGLLGGQPYLYSP
jgi:hypothetical protein